MKEEESVKPTVLITAHSGCDGTPDNSMASIQKGIALGADCVEIDVRADTQGKLWLTHDLPGDYAGLVSLRDAFALIHESGIAVNCDIKEYSALLPTLALAQKMGISREQLIFSGAVDTALLMKNPDIARQSRIFLNSEELVRDMMQGDPPDRVGQTMFLLMNSRQAAKRMRALGAEALNAPYLLVPEELMIVLRARGVALSLWTVNEEAALREYMGTDLLNITTRNASTALAVRAALG